MTREQKIEWMAIWCAKNGLQLILDGEVGFGRECVGVSTCDTYPDYQWHNENYERIDRNGDVWTPPDAYHKHTCVAVLGRGEGVENQLFEWLTWFESNGFQFQTGPSEKKNLGPIEVMMGRDRVYRMVKQ